MTDTTTETGWTAARIRALREKLGLGREKFAALANSSTQAVNFWERGVYSPDEAHRARLTEIENELGEE